MRVPMVVKPAVILLLFLLVSAADERDAVVRRRWRQVLLQEKATLLALKRGLTLPSPAALADWNESNGHVCGFTGVTCDWRREHVVGLTLANMSISGSIPPVIGELSHLRSLDLSNNSISGAVPPAVGNLTRLESLVMSDNHISGAIPPVVGNLSRLRSLDMSNNNISGAIPTAIGNLTSLKNLCMSSNLLTGPIPAELSNLRNLGVLELGNNQLRGGVPPSLAELSGMYYLSLEYNHLSGPIPAAIFLNCTKLGVADLGDNDLSGEIPRAASGTLADSFVVLNLYSNRLTGTLPRWLANCTILLTLDVENNSLADELPTSIISGKKYLKYLHLSNNRFWSHDGNSNLEPFFAALSNCSCIQEVEAGAVRMGGRLPSRLGSMLPPIMWHLNLEMNAIEGPIPADIGDVINMTLMNLSSNMLNGTIPESLCRLPSLQQLSLSDNALMGEIPPCIANASRLGELDLSGNALSGSIPNSIGSLVQLSFLSLQRNRLSGEIPTSLGRCASLMGLDLSSNRFTGVIPEEVAGIVKLTLNLSRNQLGGELPRGLSNMQQVQTIDLSWNNFTGEIFAGLSGCVELTVLDLSHNSLTGVLPWSFGGLQSLETLDVSNNSLNGEIPVSLIKCTGLKHLNLSYNNFSGVVPSTDAFARFSFLSYLGNRRLCGPVVRRGCGRHHRTWYQSRKFLVVMCVSTAALAFALTILCAVSVRKIRERLAAMREEVFRGRRSCGSSPVMKYKYPRITYRELVEVTDEFSADRLVGTGSYGQVYRGTLRDGTMVAVKVLQLQTGNSTKSFNRECQVLKRIRHRNLMRIITACSLPDFKALVLPFMANGSLERCLYAGPPAELSLVQRVNICSDIAEGMAYLHHHSPVKVIHCDLKPSNVLINDDMTALVSDFGISRLVMSIGGVANTAEVGASTVNILCGSIGYIPPEYGYGSSPTTKGDVYSFGVLVLEMVTRRKPTDDMFEAGLSLPKWVKNRHHGRADDVVDPALARMVRDQTPEVRRMSDVAIGELLELGTFCTQEHASERPTMMDAADDLERLKRYIGGDTTATFASSVGFSSTTFEDID
ncbi:putative leucine-rich repeat receptor-like serine/threonine-protein kinase At2g24130 [Phragmites australis]|uniref:putative leucine-rich repeat receptor-like serine/threonine-protein kinase At2g24130 n=1 Tax=Phragmites australis TaxID=29695 RepID=UPI002D79AE61|nr:putative leucine-rich repeat receptor-like serine/threonine-protein kinase At2g24130 [Phragmites australis]